MFLLEDLNRKIKIYTLPGCPAEYFKAKVGNHLWKDKYLFPTLAYIEVTSQLRGMGFSYRLLDLVMEDNSFLLFRNHNFNFWFHLSQKEDLPYKVVLHEPNWGEIIRKCC